VEGLRAVCDQQASSRRKKLLVVGCGNTLRGDDGAGWLVASAVADWGLPDVQAMAVHQLTPELAVPLAAVDRAIFVDARLAGNEEVCRVELLRIDSPVITLGHVSDPRFVLALCRAVYGRQPLAWSMTIPATNLSLGASPSRSTRRGMEAVLRRIARLADRFTTAGAKRRGAR
jgi:hydrogenase maturation protease